MLDLHGAQFGPAERPGKGQQQQRPVTQPSKVVLAGRDEPLQVIDVQRLRPLAGLPCVRLIPRRRSRIAG